MIWISVFVLVVLFLFFVTKSKYDSVVIKVYGSMTCPWTVKQIDYLKSKGKDYEFVDCAGGNCPDFVSGFPTSVVNGQTMVGYNEY